MLNNSATSSKVNVVKAWQSSGELAIIDQSKSASGSEAESKLSKSASSTVFSIISASSWRSFSYRVRALARATLLILIEDFNFLASRILLSNLVFFHLGIVSCGLELRVIQKMNDKNNKT